MVSIVEAESRQEGRTLRDQLRGHRHRANLRAAMEMAKRKRQLGNVNRLRDNVVITGLEVVDHLHCHVHLCCRPLWSCASAVASRHTQAGKL